MGERIFGPTIQLMKDGLRKSIHSKRVEFREILINTFHRVKNKPF